MGAAERKYAKIISLTVEHRVPLPDDDGFQDGQLPVIPLVLENAEVIDEVCSGDLMLMGFLHVVEWRVLVKIHCLAS